jgi:hypothetical protein
MTPTTPLPTPRSCSLITLWGPILYFGLIRGGYCVTIFTCINFRCQSIQKSTGKQTKSFTRITSISHIIEPNNLKTFNIRPPLSLQKVWSYKRGLYCTIIFTCVNFSSRSVQKSTSKQTVFPSESLQSI